MIKVIFFCLSVKHFLFIFLIFIKIYLSLILLSVLSYFYLIDSLPSSIESKFLSIRHCVSIKIPLIYALGFTVPT